MRRQVHNNNADKLCYRHSSSPIINAHSITCHEILWQFFGQQNVSLFSELSLGRAGSRCVLIQVYDDSTEIINSLYPLRLPVN